MPGIKDEKSLKTWLEPRPEDDARLIAARSALRALPGLASIFAFGAEKITDPYAIALTVFRAGAIAHVAGHGTALRRKVRKAAASVAFAADSAAAPTIYSSGFSAANAAASAAFSAADTTIESAARAAAFAAARSVARSAAWSAVERDAELLESGRQHGKIAASALWPGYLPDGYAEDWPTLRNTLLAHDPSWQVWTDWYQDRLDGRPIDEELEIEKALIPDEDWKKGPAHVNAIIAGLADKPENLASEIRDEEKLRAWLETRPEEDAIVIAARATLRALPSLASLLRADKIRDPYVIILPVFRASAVARVAGNGPTPRQRVEEAARSADRSAARSADSANLRDDQSAAFSAHSAVLAARAARSTASSATRFAALSADSFAEAAGRFRAWNCVSRDVERLETGAERAELLASPLWANEHPASRREDWQTLRDTLLAHDPLWRVWTDWYQDRLDGRPVDEELEIEKALIPNEDWKRGPAHVNAIIAELIRKHAKTTLELPEQAPAPTEYVFNSEVLDLVETEPAASPNDATGIAWSVLRETLEALQRGGISNSMRVAPAIDRALSALGGSPDDVDIIRCGMAGMEMQAFSEVADSVLMEDAAAMLKAAVAQHALLVAQFEEWRAFKAQLLPLLGERQAERDAVRDAADLHHELAEDGMLSEAADARMSEEEAAALPEPAVTGEVVTAQPESERGFLRSIRAAVRAFAADVLTKMRENAVKASAIGIPTGAGLVFVRYSDTLTALATKLPNEFGWVLQWIQWLKTVLV